MVSRLCISLRKSANSRFGDEWSLDHFSRVGVEDFSRVEVEDFSRIEVEDFSGVHLAMQPTGGSVVGIERSEAPC